MAWDLDPLAHDHPMDFIFESYLSPRRVVWLGSPLGVADIQPRCERLIVGLQFRKAIRDGRECNNADPSLTSNICLRLDDSRRALAFSMFQEQKRRLLRSGKCNHAWPGNFGIGEGAAKQRLLRN